MSSVNDSHLLHSDLARINQPLTIALACSTNHHTMLQARLASALQSLPSASRDNMRLLYSAFIGKNNVDDINTISAYQANTTTSLQESILGNPLQESHKRDQTPPPQSPEENPFTLHTPKNVVALHSENPIDRGTWNLTSSAAKVVKTVVEFANRKARLPSGQQSPAEENTAVTEKTVITVNIKGKVQWPYSCTTIEDYVNAWEKGNIDLPPIPIWASEFNDKNVTRFSGAQRKNARNSLWKHEKIYTEFKSGCQGDYEVWKQKWPLEQFPTMTAIFDIISKKN